MNADTRRYPDDTDALGRLGVFLLRYGLVVIFLWFGILKFTAYEAEGVAPLAMNSPLLAWALAALGTQGFAMALGVIEISVGLLIATRPFSPTLSGVGSIGGIVTFVITLTLLLSTPGVVEEGMSFPFLSVKPGQFLLKDLVLLAASVWTAGEAFRAARLSHATPMPVRPARAPSAASAPFRN